MNNYRFDLLQKSKLQQILENYPHNSRNTTDYYKKKFDEDIVSFVARYPVLNINDFLFIYDIDINLENTEILLLMLQHGHGDKIFLDQATVKYLLPSYDNPRILKYHLKKKENIIMNTMSNNCEKFPSYKRVKDAINDGHNVNMKFYNYVQTKVRSKGAEIFLLPNGVIVDVNYFIIHIINDVNHTLSRSLLEICFNIFKANNNFYIYTIELHRYEIQHILYNIRQCDDSNIRTYIQQLYALSEINTYRSDFDKTLNSLVDSVPLDFINSKFKEEIKENVVEKNTSPPTVCRIYFISTYIYISYIVYLFIFFQNTDEVNTEFTCNSENVNDDSADDDQILEQNNDEKDDNISNIYDVYEEILELEQTNRHQLIDSIPNLDFVNVNEEINLNSEFRNIIQYQSFDDIPVLDYIDINEEINLINESQDVNHDV